MAEVTLLAGDFNKKAGKEVCMRFEKGILKPAGSNNKKRFIYSIDISNLVVANENNTKSFAGTFVAGVVGGIALGGVGMLAGLLAGGNENEVIFIANLRDGRSFMARANKKTFNEISALVFQHRNISELEYASIVEKRGKKTLWEKIRFGCIISTAIFMVLIIILVQITG